MWSGKETFQGGKGKNKHVDKKEIFLISGEGKDLDVDVRNISDRER
jgi:hypothetical protein